MMRRRLTTAVIAIAALLWTATVAAMYRAVRKFESTPGRAAIARTDWPANSTIHRDSDWTLVMLVHPHCSCSRASVEELQRIIDKTPATMRSIILVYRPKEFAPGWEKTDVVNAAQHLARAKVILDEDGREAKLFGGFTSGQTFLYDDHGALRFSGGITMLRGHAGSNRGSADVIDIVRSRMASSAHPVFGCAITSSTEGATR